MWHHWTQTWEEMPAPSHYPWVTSWAPGLMKSVWPHCFQWVSSQVLKACKTTSQGKRRFYPSPHTSIWPCNNSLLVMSFPTPSHLPDWLPQIDLGPVPTCGSVCSFKHCCDESQFLLSHGVEDLLLITWYGHSAVLHNEEQLVRWGSWAGSFTALVAARRERQRNCWKALQKKDASQHRPSIHINCSSPCSLWKHHH